MSTLTSTPINQAFDFTSTINSRQIQQNTILATCIYCSHPDSTSLLQDGSFRQCTKCKKHFRPMTVTPKISQHILAQPVSYQQPIFQTMRPIYQPNNSIDKK